MKINPGWRPFGKDIKLSDSPLNQHVQQKSFSDMLQRNAEQATVEQLKQMLEHIDKQGERLARTMTVRELRTYKLLVKQFLEETVRRGVRIKDTRGWDRRGRGKRYKLLDEIDRHLLKLADEMLEHEQGRIDVLNKVGEIRGLLINLFF